MGRTPATRRFIVITACLVAVAVVLFGVITAAAEPSARTNNQAVAKRVNLRIRLFDDRNGNGIPNAGEPGYANRSILIIRQQSPQQRIIKARLRTDANGWASGSFTILPAGWFVIANAQKPGKNIGGFNWPRNKLSLVVKVPLLAPRASGNLIQFKIGSKGLSCGANGCTLAAAAGESFQPLCPPEQQPSCRLVYLKDSSGLCLGVRGRTAFTLAPCPTAPRRRLEARQTIDLLSSLANGQLCFPTSGVCMGETGQPVPTAGAPTFTTSRQTPTAAVTGGPAPTTTPGPSSCNTSSECGAGGLCIPNGSVVTDKTTEFGVGPGKYCSGTAGDDSRYTKCDPKVTSLDVCASTCAAECAQNKPFGSKAPLPWALSIWVDSKGNAFCQCGPTCGKPVSNAGAADYRAYEIPGKCTTSTTSATRTTTTSYTATTSITTTTVPPCAKDADCGTGEICSGDINSMSDRTTDFGVGPGFYCPGSASSDPTTICDASVDPISSCGSQCAQSCALSAVLYPLFELPWIATTWLHSNGATYCQCGPKCGNATANAAVVDYNAWEIPGICTPGSRR